MSQRLDGRARSVSGIQLTGRLPWDAALTAAGRKYTREPNEQNAEELFEERRRSAAQAVSLQVELGFEFVTDGGAGETDLFSPFLEGIGGVKKGGNIDRYPGTRNCYYHVPLVEGKIRPGDTNRDLTRYFPERQGLRKKAILPSPLAFALACENEVYSDRAEIARDFAGLLTDEVKALSKEGIEFVQLTECFATSPRFASRMTDELTATLGDSLDVIFEGFRGRSAIYFHSADCSPLLEEALESGVTDVGFDFNTPTEAIGGASEKNILLGVQNTTRKLPPDFVSDEVAILTDRFRDLKGALSNSQGEVWLCPSQDYDGLQTHSQAMVRLRNLGGAFRALGASN